MTQQLKYWKSKFGDDYLDRNAYENWKVKSGVEGFNRMLGNLNILSVLEVGSSLGLNLVYLDKILPVGVELYAVEPNKKAFELLAPLLLAGAWNCDGFNLPLEDTSIDLVFTAGVLIHVAPKDLGRITDEIARVARKYVLCVEYFSYQPEEVPYQGQLKLLFKRDFGAYYLDRFPDLTCIRYGFLWERDLPAFDSLTWWLFEKRRDE